jgi:fumarate reductase subunit D
MPFATPALRRALALLVIAHGLGHAVLPLRGWMRPDMLDKDFMPLILYGTAVLGFTTAGIGLFGLTPFSAVVRPALVLASGYSLVALFTFGAGDLWWAAALDVVLLLIGLTGIYRRLPTGPAHPRWPHRVAVSMATAYLLYVACAMVLWPLHRYWGSNPVEIAASLPGDGPDRNAALELQHAVTIDAPPEAVSHWVEQLGAATRSQVERRVVLRPTADGRTRFIIRSTVGRPDTPAWIAAVDMMAFELPHFIKERKMMLQIKQRAEQRKG